MVQGRATSWRRHAAALLIIFSGCRNCPVAERYFDRQDPYTSLAGFAYAVDSEQYRFAYDTLTADSQELITYSKFRFALRWGLSLPEMEDIPVRELIVNSKRSRYGGVKLDRRHEAVKVAYQRKTPQGEELITGLIWFELEPEAVAAAQERDPIWGIDLRRTLEGWRTPEGIPPPVTPAAASRSMVR